jgi:hypothetical protein
LLFQGGITFSGSLFVSPLQWSHVQVPFDNKILADTLPIHDLLEIVEDPSREGHNSRLGDLVEKNIICQTDYGLLDVIAPSTFLSLAAQKRLSVECWR